MEGSAIRKIVSRGLSPRGGFFLVVNAIMLCGGYVVYLYYGGDSRLGPRPRPQVCLELLSE